MNLEALLLITCLGNFACDKMGVAYYQSNPSFKLQIKQVRNNVEHVVGKDVMITIPATTALIMGHAYSIKITKTITFNSSKDKYLLLWSKDF